MPWWWRSCQGSRGLVLIYIWNNITADTTTILLVLFTTRGRCCIRQVVFNTCTSRGQSATRWRLCTIRRCYWGLCYSISCWIERHLFMIPASHRRGVNATEFISVNHLSQSATASYSQRAEGTATSVWRNCQEMSSVLKCLMRQKV